MKFKLNPEFIEHIHDVLVGVFLPFDQPVSAGEYRNRGCLQAATERPFQTAFQTEIWQTPAEKAAALFHSLACNHCFLNGNKRTAVIGLDIFLAANGFVLFMSLDQIYLLATSTAQANIMGRQVDVVMAELASQIESSIVEVGELEELRERLGPANFSKIRRTIDRLLSLTEDSLKSGVQVVLAANQK